MGNGVGISRYHDRGSGIIRPLRSREEQERIDAHRAAQEQAEADGVPFDQPHPLGEEGVDTDQQVVDFHLMANFDTGHALSGAQSVFYSAVVDHRRAQAKQANKGKTENERTATIDNTPTAVTNNLNHVVSFDRIRDNTSAYAKDWIIVSPNGMVTVYLDSNQGLIIPPISNAETANGTNTSAPTKLTAVKQQSTARAVAEANGGTHTTNAYDVRNTGSGNSMGWGTGMGGMATGAHQSFSPSASLPDQLQRTTLTALENGSILLGDAGVFRKDVPYVFKADIDGNRRDETITVYPPDSPMGRANFATAVYNGASLTQACDTCYTVENNEDVNGDTIRDFTEVTYKDEISDGASVPVEKLRIVYFKRPVRTED